MRMPTALLCFSFATVAACGGRDGSDATDSAGASVSAAPAESVSRSVGPSAGYRLTRERLDRYFEAEKAIHERLLRMSPAERKALSDSTEEEDVRGSVEEVARTYEASPVLAGAIRTAGFTPRDFVATMRALDHARMALTRLESAPGMNVDSLARGLETHPEDIAFVREHRADIQRLLQESNDRQVQLEKQMAEINRMQPEPE